MIQKEKYTLKIAGIFGIITVLLFTIFLSASIYFSPWFSLTDNWLSELGGSYGQNPTWTALGAGSLSFNVGLILTGLVGILFSLIIRKSNLFNTKLGKIGLLFLVIEMFALFCVGLFPITLGRIHSISSSVLFLMIPVVLLVIGYELVKIYGRNWLFITNILFVISAFSFIIFELRGSKAVAEIIALYSLFLFLTIVCTKLMRINSNSIELNIVTNRTSKKHKSALNIRNVLSSIWFKT